MEDNLKCVKDVAKLFASQKIEPTDFAPVVVVHPVYESGVTVLRNGQMVDIYNDKEMFDAAVKELHERIDNCNSITSVYLVIRKSYRLTFLKYTQKYLSLKTFSKLLADAWTTSENPNCDANVMQSEIAQWFKISEKESGKLRQLRILRLR